MWMPSSFGTWSSTITRPMPALKPVSTGAEMKLATKPRRSSRASSSIAPTSAVSVAVAVTSLRRIAVRHRQAELRAGEDRQRGGRADAEHARGAEQRVDHHRDEGGVEAHGDGQPGDRRVGHRLGQHDRRGGEPGNDVEAQRRRLRRSIGFRSERSADHAHEDLLARPGLNQYPPIVTGPHVTCTKGPRWMSRSLS